MEKQSCSPGEVPPMPIGNHCILELFGCPSALIDDVEFIQTVLQAAVKEAKATLLKEISYQFEPFGVTALALLSESHISIHTWPENGYMAIDVFTCGEHTQPEQACLYFVEAFQASNYSLMTIRRGRFAPTTRSTVRCLEKDAPGKSSLESQKISVKTSV